MSIIPIYPCRTPTELPSARCPLQYDEQDKVTLDVRARANACRSQHFHEDKAPACCATVCSAGASPPFR